MALLPHACFLAVALLTTLIYITILRWMGSVSEYQNYTAMQLGMAIGYGLVLAGWLGAEAGFLIMRHQPKYESIDVTSEDEETASMSPIKSADEPRELPNEVLLGFISPRQLPALRAAGEFVVIMGYVYLCDRTTLFSKGPKEYNKLRFWGLNAAIAVAALATMKATSPAGEEAKPLQREQTEEWKGWMQLMFILYHYFAEAEIYNAIRLKGVLDRCFFAF